MDERIAVWILGSEKVQGMRLYSHGHAPEEHDEREIAISSGMKRRLVVVVNVHEVRGMEIEAERKRGSDVRAQKFMCTTCAIGRKTHQVVYFV